MNATIAAKRGITRFSQENTGRNNNNNFILMIRMDTYKRGAMIHDMSHRTTSPFLLQAPRLKPLDNSRHTVVIGGYIHS